MLIRCFTLLIISCYVSETRCRSVQSSLRSRSKYDPKALFDSSDGMHIGLVPIWQDQHVRPANPCKQVIGDQGTEMMATKRSESSMVAEVKRPVRRSSGATSRTGQAEASSSSQRRTSWYRSLNDRQKYDVEATLLNLCGLENRNQSWEEARKLAMSHLSEEDYHIIMSSNASMMSKAEAAQRTILHRDLTKAKDEVRALLKNSYDMPARSVARYLLKITDDDMMSGRTSSEIAQGLYHDYTETPQFKTNLLNHDPHMM